MYVNAVRKAVGESVYFKEMVPPKNVNLLLEVKRLNINTTATWKHWYDPIHVVHPIHSEDQ